MSVGKKILRGVVKTTAVCAGVVFLFDNKITGNVGMVLLALIAVLLACGLTWLFFGRSEHNGLLAEEAGRVVHSRGVIPNAREFTSGRRDLAWN